MSYFEACTFVVATVALAVSVLDTFVLYPRHRKRMREQMRAIRADLFCAVCGQVVCRHPPSSGMGWAERNRRNGSPCVAGLPECGGRSSAAGCCGWCEGQA